MNTPKKNTARSNSTLAVETGAAREICGWLDFVEVSPESCIASRSLKSTVDREQAIGLHEINTAVGTMDRNTQQNTAMVEETPAVCQRLDNEAIQLNRLLTQFRLAQVSRSSYIDTSVLRAQRPRPAS